MKCLWHSVWHQYVCILYIYILTTIIILHAEYWIYFRNLCVFHLSRLVDCDLVWLMARIYLFIYFYRVFFLPYHSKTNHPVANVTKQITYNFWHIAFAKFAHGKTSEDQHEVELIAFVRLHFFCMVCRRDDYQLLGFSEKSFIESENWRSFPWQPVFDVLLTTLVGVTRHNNNTKNISNERCQMRHNRCNWENNLVCWRGESERNGIIFGEVFHNIECQNQVHENNREK